MPAAVGESIDVVVSPDGAVSISAHGFKGKGCEEATKFLEKALGTRTGQKRTSDYYTPQPTKVKQQHKR